jgi:NMD protein affecting ribosome stability and mRNA decay
MERKKRPSHYYEAILQLRRVDHEVVEMVEKEIRISSHKDIFVSKVKKVPGGTDFYLSSNKFTIGLGRTLNDKFGGELTIAEKLFSKDRHSGKELYRVTVLFRASPFKNGSSVLYKNKAFRISSVDKKKSMKKMSAVDLETGKHTKLDYVDVAKHAEILESVNVVVSKTEPSLEVIHPESFQSTPVIFQPKQKTPTKGKITVVVRGEKIWILPPK